jgi:hypothetical protein
MKALPQAKSPKLKNHISGRGKVLINQLSNKFGVSLADFEKAVMGDLPAMQKIGELSRKAEFAKEFAPKLRDAYITILEGSEAYNVAIADILKQAGKSTIAIDKAANSVTLANTKYINQRVELAQQFVRDRQTEKVRHDYQLNYQQIKGYIDAHIVSVDNDSSILEQSNRPEQKQIAADETLHHKQMNEALSKGDNARYDLIPEKQYTGGFKAKLMEFKAALGF